MTKYFIGRFIIFMLVVPFIKLQAVDQEELRRLKINSYQNDSANDRKAKASNISIDVEEIKIPQQVKLKEYPGLPLITIKDGNFYKDDNAAYLIGAECSAQTRYPFLWKLFDFDFIQVVGPVYLKQTMLCTQNDDRINIRWKPNQDLERDVRLIIENGLPVYVNFIEGDPNYIRKNFPPLKNIDNLLVDNGHFYSMRWENPIAASIRRNFFKSMITPIMSYPVFAVELFNEVSFMDYDTKVIEGFRKFCFEKYGTMSRANHIWNTNYKSFVEVIPARINGINCSYESLAHDTSRMLWRDWREFCGLYSARAFGEVAELFRKHMPTTKITIQSHCNYMLDMAPSGINPLEKSRNEDFYGDENRFQFYKQYPGQESLSQISSMVGTLLWINYLAHLVPDKPQMSEETYPQSGPPKTVEYLKINNTKWYFKGDNEENGTINGYQDINFNDKNWAEIEVPGMWANYGHGQIHTGWYRKAFFIENNKLPSQLFLNGHELADSSAIYFNGKLINMTKRWKDNFSLDITPLLRNGKNMIAIKIVNKNYKAERYWGGIRGGISLDTSSRLPPPLTYGQLSCFVWERWLHGENGVVISYVYAAEGTAHSIFYPARIERKALKALPESKYIINSIAQEIAPEKQRIPAKAALCFPMETMRFHIFPKYNDILEAPITKSVSLWFAALLTSGVPGDVIPNSVLEDKAKLAKYDLIMMRKNSRISAKGFDNLKEFLANGGVLIRDNSSLKNDDATNQPLDNSNMLSGKGKIHIIPDSISEEDSFSLLRELIIKYSGMPITVTTENTSVAYVERYLLDKNGRYLLYLNNWGGEQTVRVIPHTIVDGTYRLTNLNSGKVDSEKITNKQLCEIGIKIDLPCQTPQMLLLESSDLPALTIKRLSPKQKMWFDFIEGNYAAQSLSERILFSGGQNCYYSKIFLLTAAEELQKNGYSSDLGIPPIRTNEMQVFTNRLTVSDLSDYKVLFLGGPREFTPDEIKVIKNYLINGGGLFICGNWSRGPHKWLSNSSVNASFLKDIGATVVDEGIQNPVNFCDNTPWHPVFKDFTNHILCKNIREIHTQGMGFLNLYTPDWQPLVLSDKHANYPYKPVIAVRNYGKGRIVLCGDAAWLKPRMLSRGNNKEFFINLINWLAQKNSN